MDTAFTCALEAAPLWQATPPADRAAVLRQAATLFEAKLPFLVGLIVREAGKTIPNAIGEVREAVGFPPLLRRANRAANSTMIRIARSGPWSASARGISRWRFSLARLPLRWQPAMPCSPNQRKKHR